MNRDENTIKVSSTHEGFIKKAIFFIYKIFFLFLCYKVGIKASKEGMYHLWKSRALKLWIKITFKIAFYPRRRLQYHVRVLEKYTVEPCGAGADVIGPGKEFLSWFQNLHSIETTNKFFQLIWKHQLTRKQKAFVFALSNKLATRSPAVVFEMLKSRRLVNAWFTIAKVLADHPFKKLDQLFEDLSKQTSLSISSSDLLNSKTMLAWLERCLQFFSNPELNAATLDKNNPDKWTVKSHYYFICESSTNCWKCSQTTPVYAIALPSESFTWFEIEEDMFAWVQEKHPGILKYVTAFQPDDTDMGRIFYKDFSHAAKISYWMNHCIHCGMKQGDNPLHKPGCAFWPLTSEASKQLKVYKYFHPITARCTRLEFLCLEDIPELNVV